MNNGVWNWVFIMPSCDCAIRAKCSSSYFSNHSLITMMQSYLCIDECILRWSLIDGFSIAIHSFIDLWNVNWLFIIIFMRNKDVIMIIFIHSFNFAIFLWRVDCTSPSPLNQLIKELLLSLNTTGMLFCN